MAPLRLSGPIIGFACIGALLGAGPALAANQQITAATNATVFNPAEATISPGDVVTISKAAGGLAHSSHYDDSAQGCPVAPTTSAWSCTRMFESVGDYTFDCDAHPTMQGTVHVVPLPVGAVAPGRTQLLTPNASGSASGNAAELLSSNAGPPIRQVSDDGRYLVFISGATNLTTLADTNAAADVFRRDRVTGATTLVSVNSAGTAAAAGQSLGPAISADGRFVALESRAGDVVSGLTDANGAGGDVYLRDMDLGITTLVSASPAGPKTTGNAASEGGQSISADGHRISFGSDATNLVAGVTDANGAPDLFVRDVQAGSTVAVSATPAGNATGNDISSAPEISEDGRFVVFSSHASNLVGTDTNGGVAQWDVFRRDLQTGTTDVASVNAAGTDTGSGLSGSQITPTISADGSRVLFISQADDLVDGFLDNNGTFWDLFQRDFDTGETTLVSGTSATAGATSGSASGLMSPDGALSHSPRARLSIRQ